MMMSPHQPVQYHHPSSWTKTGLFPTSSTPTILSQLPPPCVESCGGMAHSSPRDCITSLVSSPVHRTVKLTSASPLLALNPGRWVMPTAVVLCVSFSNLHRPVIWVSSTDPSLTCWHSSQWSPFVKWMSKAFASSLLPSSSWTESPPHRQNWQIHNCNRWFASCLK